MSAGHLMHFAVDLSFVHTDYLWRTPGSWVGYDYYGADFYEEIARTASRGVLDMVFFGDAAETPENHGGNHHAAVRLGVRWPKHDMMPMVPIMARAAPGVGFGLTMSTTYHQPFHVARLFSSLDHITGGRIAWNAVTSAYKNEAANYGYSVMMDHDRRYDRAREHLQVVRDLWDSVEADAILLDRDTGIFADPDKVHLLNHHGEFFNVRGPLPVLPSPQGRPVIIQAGQSGPGLDLASTYADMQFGARRTVQSMKDHRKRLDDNLVRRGRGPRDVGILWQIRIQVGETDAEAHEKERRFIESLPPDAGLIELSNLYGLDFSILRGDMRLADTAEAVRAQNAQWGSYEEILKTADPEMTVEEFSRQVIADRVLTATGTPRSIADRLEMLHHETGANGGFMLSKGSSAPGNLNEFVDLVVPELQRRGLMKKSYVGATLRENLS